MTGVQTCALPIYELIEALAAYHAVAVSALHVGAGIDEILGDLVRIAANPGETVVMPLGSYPTFAYHVSGYGARLVEVPYVQDHVDLPGWAAAARDLHYLPARRASELACRGAVTVRAAVLLPAARNERRRRERGGFRCRGVRDLGSRLGRADPGWRAL